MGAGKRRALGDQGCHDSLAALKIDSGNPYNRRMDIQEFRILLARAGFSKAELARRLGLTPQTVSDWKGAPPRYALAYLGLYVKVKEAL